MADFIKPFHRKPYSYISPTNPSLNQAGRTVLVTGASGGIGRAIAKAFAAAGTKRLILAARRESSLAEVKAEIEAKGGSTIVQVENLDISDLDSIRKLYASLAERKIEIDVLVLNAAFAETVDNLVSEETGPRLWKAYQTNVLGSHLMSQRFIAQGQDGKALINISTAAVHWNPVPQPLSTYSTTKASFTHLFQCMAYEVPVEKCQMISFHPGAIYTPGAQKAGFGPDAMPWDHIELPANYTVWTATKDAAFLHGRFTWAHWDIEELKKTMGERQDDPTFLKIGLQGINGIHATKVIEQIVAIDSGNYANA